MDGIDVGAESTGTNADIVDVDGQLASLMPVLEALLADGLLVSVETYLTDVAVAALEAGAQVIDLPTGEVYSALHRRFLGALIGWMADMIGNGSGRIDMNLLLKAGINDLLPENTFSCG